MSTQVKIILALILTALLGFGLGYLIRGEVKKSPIIIDRFE